jgi:dTDP-4-amino-4,6-dideoxygalactose transaminase
MPENNHRVRVPFIDLLAESTNHIEDVKAAVNKVIDSGSYILGDEVLKFEDQVKRITGSQFCSGVANGTDALVLVLKYLDLHPEDEVITVSNSYLATVSAIILAGATPVLADVNQHDGLISIESIKNSISPKTKAIIAVHLGGYLAELEALSTLCADNGIALIEDCAQAFGTRDSKGQHVGTLGLAGCFSAHPLKNLAAMGDAGFIITNDKQLAEWLKKARSHGHINRDDIEFPSINSRLDEVQAAILNVKTRFYMENIACRRSKVMQYRQLIGNRVPFPTLNEINSSSHHLLIVCVPHREILMTKLIDKHGIELKIHYPKPYHKLSIQNKLKIHDQLKTTDARASSIVSLPLGAHITDDIILKITEEINSHVQI